jgi:hypothetical protein
VRRALIVIVAVGCLAACGGSGGSKDTLKIKFGLIGGLIAPYTITIAPDGAVTTTGNPPATPKALTTAQDEELSRKVRDGFGNLTSMNCPRTFPDEAANFITARGRTVTVRGTCERGFTMLWSALTSAIRLPQ